jgi:two-component system phosphate regulon sensor histidine kinase PhoR
MRKRKLFWNIFPAFLLVVLISLLALTWYATEAFHQFYLERVSSNLKAQASLVKGRLNSALAKDPEGVNDVCRELGRVSPSRITVILPDGKVIGDSEEDPRKMDNHADRTEIVEALAGRKGTSIRYSHTLKENMMYVAIPLGDTAGVLRMSISVAFVDEALGEIYFNVAAAGVIVALLASIMSLVISRRISRPLEEMKRGAERFAGGDFEKKLVVPNSLELGGLAEAMNQMASQLDERIRTVLSQRNEMEAILSSMVEGVLAVDTEDRIISINRAAARMFDVDPTVVLGKSLPEAIRNISLLQFVPKALSCENQCEEEIIVLGEGERHLQAHGAALLDAQDKKIGALVVLNDITKLSRLEKVRRDFVANVSHELKTPVTAIKGAAETLRDGAMSIAEDADHFLAILLRQADRMNAIIEDLLLLARMEQDGEERTLKLLELPLRTVLSAAVQACSPAAKEKGIPLQLSCNDDIVARMDPVLLEQAVVNLIDNAIKYSKPGATLSIRGIPKDATAVIEVEDHGMGIDARHLDRLFERFYRVDKARSRKMGGTGLGLAIVKHIVQAHGGSVEVRSTPGAGSVFSLLLPVPVPQTPPV